MVLPVAALAASFFLPGLLGGLDARLATTVLLPWVASVVFQRLLGAPCALYPSHYATPAYALKRLGLSDGPSPFPTLSAPLHFP